MQRKTYCSCDSDLKKFFNLQIGSGFSDIDVFRGSPYQRGYGIGSLIGRFGIPILKFLGKHALKTGVAVGSDLLEKKRFKEALKSRATETLKNAASESMGKINKVLQQGSGYKRKRRRLYKKNRQYKKQYKSKRRVKKKSTKRKVKSRKKRRDIF